MINAIIILTTRKMFLDPKMNKGNKVEFMEGSTKGKYTVHLKVKMNSSIKLVASSTLFPPKQI